MTLDSFQVKYSRLVDALCDSLPTSKIVLQSMLPINRTKYDMYGDNHKISQCNSLIEKIALEFGCEYVDLFSLYIENGELPQSYAPDGIHILPEYYERWADCIRPIVESL